MLSKLRSSSLPWNAPLVPISLGSLIKYYLAGTEKQTLSNGTGTAQGGKLMGKLMCPVRPSREKWLAGFQDKETLESFKGGQHILWPAGRREVQPGKQNN